jgi:hypothetical protein
MWHYTLIFYLFFKLQLLFLFLFQKTNKLIKIKKNEKEKIKATTSNLGLFYLEELKKWWKNQTTTSSLP